MDNKYAIQQRDVQTLLTWVENGQIAIPEIQRPFVWSKSQVRNLIDSLYQGYPVGYIITWQNPTVNLKDGTTSRGKTILIDGQQRVTSLRAAISAQTVVNDKYREETIRISFNPLTEEFKTQTASTLRGSEWIADISEVMQIGYDALAFLDHYMRKNPNADKSLVWERVNQLIQIKNKQIGEIQLSEELPIEIVNEIFVRINKSGVNLSSADFAMSKIAVYEIEPGDEFGMFLRKFIDYFCNLAVAPDQLDSIRENDTKFARTDYYQRIKWLGKETEDLYDPGYGDVLRVATLTVFNRGKLEDLVALLSGRNFETRQYEQEIMDESFKKLEAGIHSFTNQNSFKHFIDNVLKASKFDDASMLGAKNSVNYAYAMFLRARAIGENHSEVNSLIRRLFVLSQLTGRHSGSFETTFEADIKKLKKTGDLRRLVETLEEQELSEVFWRVTLPDEFDKSQINNPFWHVFMAAQKKLSMTSFLAPELLVSDMTTGDIHHIFPKGYLVKHGFSKTQYNKIANFVYLRNDINISVSDKEPRNYIGTILEKKGSFHSSIASREQLLENLSDNALPEMVIDATHEDYEEFMAVRRVLMAQLAERYYRSL